MTGSLLKKATNFFRATLGKEKSPSEEVRAQLEQFKVAKESDKASWWEARFNAPDLAERLAGAGVKVEEARIDVNCFEAWLKDFKPLEEFYNKMGDVKTEKLLEHYLTYTHLGISPGKVFMDVAAAGSPFADMLSDKGVTAWKQDLSYPEGIEGRQIGGNAASLPLEEDFADIMALHCAFECFRGDADMGFARDAARLLKKNGRLGIVPLYLDTVHFVKTSPWCEKSRIEVEKDARWLWRDDRYKEPFSRHYSPEAFALRVAAQMKGMDGRVLHFTNLDEVFARYPGQRIYCHFMFLGVKL